MVQRASLQLFSAHCRHVVGRLMSLVLCFSMFCVADLFAEAQAHSLVSDGGHITGMAVTSTGDVVVADTWNHTLVRYSPAGIGTVIAGTGTRIAGFSGDGGPATAAMLGDLGGIAIDAADNIYLCDYGNCRLRKIDTAGNIHTIAGTGVDSSTGDGGLASVATMKPRSVCVSASGEIYITDIYAVVTQGTSRSVRVRKISASGIISAVVGGGVNRSDSATAADVQFGAGALQIDQTGDVYIGDGTRIWKYTTSGSLTRIAGSATSGFSGDGGPAIQATFSGIDGICVDAQGVIYIDDSRNTRIRKVDTSGIVSTFAGVTQNRN